MRDSDKNQVWKGDDAPENEAVAGVVPAATTSPAETRPSVLAQVPDIDPLEAAPPQPVSRKSRGGDGRIISQSLAKKLLIGGGVLLVLAAIVPFLLRKPIPGGEKTLAPEAEVAPTFEQGARQPRVVEPIIEDSPPELQFDIQGTGDLALPPGLDVSVVEPNQDGPATPPPCESFQNCPAPWTLKTSLPPTRR